MRGTRALGAVCGIWAAVTGCGPAKGKPAATAGLTVSNEEGLVVVEVSSGAPEAGSVVLRGKTYATLGLANFTSRAAPGEPLLPVAFVHVAVPDGQTLSYEVADEEAPEMMVLDQRLAFESRPKDHADGHALVRLDEEAYGKVHGREAVTLEELSFGGAHRVARFKVTPVRYDPEAGMATVRSRFTVRIRFTDGDDSLAPVGLNAAHPLRHVVVNPEALPEQGRAAPVDLIIADATYQAALQSYVAFKQQRGRVVRERYVSAPTTQAVQNLIKAEYAAAEPPSETLIVGSFLQIPMWRGTSDNTWTDAPYANLDAGTVPDLALGRVPARTEAELAAFVAKAMARETDLRPYDDILLTAGSDTGLGCPANVARVGEKIRPAGPEINLIRRFRSEGVTTDQVLAAYNANPNVIFYDGHGDRQGMQEIPLTISNLNRLTNDRYPIIFDIACLNANWGNSRNFAEAVLLKETSGAAGILASGGSGYGHDFFQNVGKFMADGRVALRDRRDGLLNEVGQTILAAKILGDSQDRSFWNYYGDPASSVWEAP